MKQSELQPCANCGKGMMHSGQIHFYRAEISQQIVDMRAVQRQHGLEMMLGGAAALAQAMSPNDDIAIQCASKTVLLCADCGMSQHLPVAVLMEDDR